VFFLSLSFLGAGIVTILIRDQIRRTQGGTTAAEKKASLLLMQAD